MIGYIILAVVVVILAFALYSQKNSAKQQAEKGEQLLKDYQKRVDEMEKLLSDYRSLEQNFDNVGQGYEQALLAFDKMEEDKQKMQNIVDALRKQNEELQQSSSQISGSMLQKKQIIEKAALEAKKQIVANPALALKQLNNILNAKDIDMETAIEADDNILVSQVLDKAINESGIKATNYLTFKEEVPEEVKSMMLLTNEAELSRALAIILDNAVKFTTEGSVKLSATADGSNL
jgi:signal transduction histidine kinase